MHIQDTFYYCGGFTGGIYIFIKIKSEIRIFDLINSVKEKKICKCDLLKEQMKFGKKSFEILPPGFSKHLICGIN